MALITRFEHSASGSTKLDPTTVTCEWVSFSTPNGPVLQLRTGGSDTRQNPGKPSQKIQLDRDAASALLGLMLSTFPGLEPS